MNDQTTQHVQSQDGDMPPASPAYLSPVLRGLDPEHRPEPSPACETCPLSLWFAGEEMLSCYCQRMHTLVWSSDRLPILRCDGRELALAALAETER